MTRVLKKTASVVVSVTAILVLVHATWNWAASRALSHTWQTQAKQGLPMSVKEISPRPVPSERNAAPLLNRAFAGMKRGAAETETYNMPVLALLSYGFPSPYGSDNTKDLRILSAEEKQKLMVSLGLPPVAPLMGLLEDAAQKSECRFDVDYCRGPAVLPHLMHLRNAVRLLTIRAWLRADAKDAQGALQDVLTGLRITSFLKEEPTIISLLTRIRCNHDCTRALNGILNMIPPSQLPDGQTLALLVQLEAQADPENAALVAALDGERIMFGSLFYNRIIRSRMEPDDLASMGLPRGMSRYVGYVARPWAKTDFRYYLVSMAEYRARAQRPFPEILRKPPLAESIPRRYVLARLILPALDGCYREAARGRAEIDLARIGLMAARERKEQGAYPVDLGQIGTPDDFPRDPFSGKQFIYRRSGDGFILYSAGPDSEDDHATPPGSDSIVDDIVWQIDGTGPK